MSLNLALLNAAVIARAATDAQGAALRAALGNPVTSIMDAEDLRAENLPEFPLIALRRGPAPTTERTVRLPLYTWYVFDEPLQGNWRIDQVITLLMRLYDPSSGATLLSMPAQGLIADVQTDIGPHYIDPMLGLPASWLRLAITAGA